MEWLIRTQPTPYGIQRIIHLPHGTHSHIHLRCMWTTSKSSTPRMGGVRRYFLHTRTCLHCRLCLHRPRHTHICARPPLSHTKYLWYMALSSSHRLWALKADRISIQGSPSLHQNQVTAYLFFLGIIGRLLWHETTSSTLRPLSATDPTLLETPRSLSTRPISEIKYSFFPYNEDTHRAQYHPPLQRPQNSSIADSSTFSPEFQPPAIRLS